MAKYKNDTLIHYWAHDDGEGAANSLKCNRGILYSYDVIIGRKMGDIHDIYGEVTLLNSTTYSVTTSSHQSDASFAVNHHKRFYVPNLGSGSWDMKKEDHIENLSYFCASVEISIKSAAKAKSRKDEHLARVSSLIEAFEEYAEIFKLRSNGKVKTIRKRMLKYAGTDLKDLKLIQEKEAKKAKAAIKRNEKAKIVELQEKIDIWRVGGVIYSGQHGFNNIPCMLRVSRDNHQIETSHGASIPIEEAPKLWSIVSRCKKKSEGFYLATMQIGNFFGLNVTIKGDLMIGCHKISFEEISLTAKTLGYI